MSNDVAIIDTLPLVYPGSDMKRIQQITVVLGSTAAWFEVAAGVAKWRIALLGVNYIEANACNIDWGYAPADSDWSTVTPTSFARWECAANQAPNYRIGQPIFTLPVGQDLGMKGSGTISLAVLTVGIFTHHTVRG